jgi:hypothetical protein
MVLIQKVIYTKLQIPLSDSFGIRYKQKSYTMIKNFIKTIKLGDWVESGIHFFLLGYGEKIALFIAKTFFNSNKCYCCERKEFLNRLTNPSYDGRCNEIKLF